MWNLKKSVPTPARAMWLLRPTELEALREVHAAKGRALVVLKRYVPRASEYWLLRASLFFEHHDRFPDLVQVQKATSFEGLLDLIICPWPGDKDKGDD
jgi:hypothetical protein